MSHSSVALRRRLQALGRALATRGEPAQSLIEWALLIVVFVVVVVVGLTPLASAVGGAFTDLASHIRMPANFP